MLSDKVINTKVDGWLTETRNDKFYSSGEGPPTQQLICPFNEMEFNVGDILKITFEDGVGEFIVKLIDSSGLHRFAEMRFGDIIMMPNVVIKRVR